MFLSGHTQDRVPGQDQDPEGEEEGLDHRQGHDLVAEAEEAGTGVAADRAAEVKVLGRVHRHRIPHDCPFPTLERTCEIRQLLNSRPGNCCISCNDLSVEKVNITSSDTL